MNTLRHVLASALTVLLAMPMAAADAPGADRAAFALTGGRVIVSPGHVVDPGAVVRGGVIEAVGPAGSTAVPADARVFDVHGKVVHAAYIDAYVPTDRLAGKGPRKPPDEEEASAAGSRRSRGPSPAAVPP